jgi:hypothetical protein
LGSFRVSLGNTCIKQVVLFRNITNLETNRKYFKLKTENETDEQQCKKHEKKKTNAHDLED